MLRCIPNATLFVMAQPQSLAKPSERMGREKPRAFWIEFNVQNAEDFFGAALMPLVDPPLLGPKLGKWCHLHHLAIIGPMRPSRRIFASVRKRKVKGSGGRAVERDLYGSITEAILFVRTELIGGSGPLESTFGLHAFKSLG